jgi:hypothetical protein
MLSIPLMFNLNNQVSCAGEVVASPTQESNLILYVIAGISIF